MFEKNKNKKKTASHVHRYYMSVKKKLARQFLKGERNIRVYLVTRQLGVTQPGCSYCDANIQVARA